MNTALFEEKRPELQATIEQWFANNCPAEYNDIVEIKISIRKRLPSAFIELSLSQEGMNPNELDRLLSTRIDCVSFVKYDYHIKQYICRFGPKTLGELARLTNQDLLRYRGVGPKTERSITETLHLLNLKLGTSYPIGPIEREIIEQLKDKSS